MAIIQTKYYIDKKLNWSNELLKVLKLDENSYSLVDLENHIMKNFAFFNNKEIKCSLKFNQDETNTLKIPGYINKIRLSFFMNHIIKNFTLENREPHSFYFTNDSEEKKLSDNQIHTILSNL